MSHVVACVRGQVVNLSRFATVGVPSILLTTGKWYYEILIESNDIFQIGYVAKG